MKSPSKSSSQDPSDQELSKRSTMQIQRKFFIPFSKKSNIRDEYKFIKEIGVGATGRVFEAIHNVSGETRAIKIVMKMDLENEESLREEIREEYRILMEADHPNIIKLYEVFETSSCLSLVMEYCEGGELFELISEMNHLQEAQVAVIVKQILAALSYCHKNMIIHRDIKPENFMFSRNGDINSIKMIDFGFSKKMTKGELLRTPNGTLYFLAPEMMDG